MRVYVIPYSTKLMVMPAYRISVAFIPVYKISDRLSVTKSSASVM